LEELVPARGEQSLSRRNAGKVSYGGGEGCHRWPESEKD